MTTEAERQAHVGAPPTQSTTPGDGVTILATSTSAASVEIPEGWYRKRLAVEAGGDAVWIAFGPASTPAIDRTYAGGATVAAGTKAENAKRIAARGTLEVTLDRRVHKYLHMQAEANTPTVTVYALSGPRPK